MYLELNRKITRALNPKNRSIWNVVNNNPNSKYKIQANPPDLLVFNGIEFDPNKARPTSYHHSTGLNKAIRLVKTRFALILDPDFYIVRKNWISEIIEHMKINGLAFFGAPINPRYSKNYRYFPGVNCMFIDLKHIRMETLDFRPGQDDFLARESTTFIGKLTRRFNSIIINELYQRFKIGLSQDTGYNIYNRYSRQRKIKSECIIPVYQKLEYPKNNFLNYLNYLSKLIPERFSYYPKRSDSYSQSGFHEHGFIDLRSLGWEEYLWKDKPFSFHLRSFRDKQDTETEKNNLYRAIINLTGMELSE